MRPFALDDRAFTGLEAAMVFIAFIVVASVFAYVALGAGFFTTQRTEQTVYSAVQQVGSIVQIVEPIMVQASASGDSIRYIVITVRVSQDADIDVEQIVVTVSTGEAMQTYKGAALWHSIGNDGQDPIFWYVQIPLYQADDPTIPDDLVISQNQKFFVEMKSADAVPCTVERRAPAGMKSDSWYGV
jgi:flagellin FlaB